MFDGKMFFALTGTPMRNNDLAQRRFALAEPDPLTLANFSTKSFGTLSSGMYLLLFILCLGIPKTELLHIPCAGGTPFGAETTM